MSLVGDVHDVALGRFKNHLPSLRPPVQLTQILGKGPVISLSPDFPIDSAVISEQSHFRGNIALDVIDINQEKNGADHRALRDS